MPLSTPIRAALLALLLGSGCSTPPTPAVAQDPELQEPPVVSEALPALQKRIRFEKAGTLPELLDHLRTLTGANLVLDSRLLQTLEEFQRSDAPRARQNLVLRDVTGECALRWMLSRCAFKVDFVVRGGVALIDDRARLHPPLRRVHDLQGIRFVPGDRPGGSLSLGSEETIGLSLTAESGGGAGSSVRDEGIIDLIKETVAPGTWEGTRTIERVNESHLLVSATPEVQDEVSWLLGALRSCSPSTVSLSAEIADADLATLPWLASDAPTLLSPADADVLSRRLRASKSGCIDITGLDGGRVSTLHTQNTSSLIAYQANGDPLLGTWLSDVSILDVRPTLTAGGRAVSVELRLSLGQSRDLPALETGAGPLPRQERMVTRLGTTFLVPHGGALVFSLPARNSAQPRPQVCLLRASWEYPPAGPPRMPLRRPPPPEQRELLDRLEHGPAADANFKSSPLGQVVDWLRSATGLNWLLEPGLDDLPVTFRSSGVSVARILPLLLAPLQLDFRARDDALVISSRPTLRKTNETCVIGIRNALGAAQDFPGRPDQEVRQAFTGEDLANLVKNTIHKDRWEEADGHSIQLTDGALVVRNSPDVIREILAFVEAQRTRPRRSVAIRAEILTLPATAAGMLPDPPGFIDAAQAEKLVAAAGPSRERLSWQAQDGQRSSLTWDRALDYLWEAEEKGASIRSIHACSMVEISASSDKGGSWVALELYVKDQRVSEIRQAPLKAKGIELPLLASQELTTSLSLPAGKTAVFRWAEPDKAGEERQLRILLIQAVALPEPR